MLLYIATMSGELLVQVIGVRLCKDGDANENGQKVSSFADLTYGSCKAIFWFRCADKKMKFVVSQQLEVAIIPDENNTLLYEND